MIGCLLAVALAAATAQSPPDGRQWFTLSVDGVRTGYAFEERRIEHGIVVERTSTTIVVRELGRRERIEYDATLRRSVSGQPISFDYRQETGTDREQWHGDFADGQLVIRQRDGTQWKTSRVDVPADAVLSPLRRADVA